MPADKPTELSRIKLKTWTRQPVPMISKHSTHSTSLPVGFRTWLWRYTCLLLISMLWHGQAICESKGDTLSSSVECRIRTQGLRHLFASRLNACWHTDWAIEDQAKNLNSTARPYGHDALINSILRLCMVAKEERQHGILFSASPLRTHPTPIALHPPSKHIDCVQGIQWTSAVRTELLTDIIVWC